MTTLATALQSLAGTEAGNALISRLQDDDRTVFAPTNEAFAALGDGALDNTDTLGEIIVYHIVSDDVSDDNIPVSPGHSVVDTFRSYNTSGDDDVPLILTRLSADSPDFVIFNNNDTIAVNGPTEVGNLRIYTIDRVIPLPPTLGELVESAGLTGLTPLLTAFNESQGPINGPLTIFAPNNEAFEAIASALEGLDEQAQFQVLQNHIVSGIYYSDDVADAIPSGDDDDDDNDDTITPLAGPVFTVSSNDTGIFISSGSASAQVVGTDYLFEGGVVHVGPSIFRRSRSCPSADYQIIDSVLVNENPETNTPTGTGGNGSPSSITSSGAPQTSGPSSDQDNNDPTQSPNPASKVAWNAGATVCGLAVTLSALVGGSLVL